MKKLCFFAVATMFALVSCNDEKQSELTQEMLGLSGEATIEISFYYNQGPHKLSDGTIFEGVEFAPVEEVIATVDYSQYSNQDAGKVFKQFKATKISEGTYKLTIPAGEKKVSVEVMPKGFTAKFYTSPELYTDAYYEMGAAIPFDVLAGMTIVEKDPGNTEITKASEAVNNSQSIDFAIKGKVTRYVEKRSKVDSDCEDDCSYKVGLSSEKVNSATLEVKVKCSSDLLGRSITYTVTTNAEGEYTANVKLYDAWNLDDIEATVTPQAFNAEVTHYYQEASQSYVRSIVHGENLSTYPYGVYSSKSSGWKSIMVQGYWEGTALPITLTENQIQLAKQSVNNDITLTFTPLSYTLEGETITDVCNIPGVVDGGDVTYKVYDTKAHFEAEEKDPANLKTEYTLKRYVVADHMGWTCK